MKALTPAQRLIVALDINPTQTVSYSAAIKSIYALAEKLAPSGVVVKVNSVLRYAGISMLKDLYDIGLYTFADLKLCDIPNTLINDGWFLTECQPDMITVMCSAGVEAMHALKQILGDQTEVLGVTVLTSLNENQCLIIHGSKPTDTFQKLAIMAKEAKIDGLILSPQELGFLPYNNHLSLICPGIRPAWSMVKGDDQRRVMTPREAIARGAERIVVGRPITQHPDPIEAVAMTIAEINQGLTDRA
ncbi:MAG: orotidine-5'-phosphate decarboxylase [Patescibacteria group bacterium]|nr:orotidine-5'-phosphate decarboxylase [Patescibacteria group bacterium]